MIRSTDLHKRACVLAALAVAVLLVARAKAVADVLLDVGIAATRVRFWGQGGSWPIADNTTRAGRAMNRRVEVFLSKARK